jgi:polyisoprenyl-phosphate glycosyltransferase
VDIAPRLAIVVPCYNEQDALPRTARELLGLCDRMTSRGVIAADSELYFVDDGSRDGTWALIDRLANAERGVRGIKLSRNRGHQNAILAGMFEAEGDIVVTIDADLQDDASVIEAMVNAHRRGADIVYGVRARRETDSPFKRLSAQLYYRILLLLGVDIVFNHADFRLMSRRAIEALRAHDEVNLFLRGIVPTLGFPSEIVHYERAERMAGESKYPLRKMLALAADGITSFSAVPLRLIATLGLVMFVTSLLLSLWVLWIRLFTSKAVPGWASLTLPMYLLAGIQLLSVGVVGEYVGKIYMETKRRPRYFIERISGGRGRSDQPVIGNRRPAGTQLARSAEQDASSP